MRHYGKECLAELRRHGVEGRLDWGGRRGHPRIYFTVDGREQFYVLASSASDSAHGLRNCLADLRRMVGASNARHKSMGEKRQRAAKPKPTLPAKLTIREDPFAKLIVLALTPDEAWRAYWRTLCQDLFGTNSIEETIR